MSDYIEREKLDNWLLTEPASLDTQVDREYVVGRLREEIPGADVRPVVRGYWHGEGDGYADGELVCDMWQCSCCGEWFDEWDDTPTGNVCPNCGADMREVVGNG